MTVDDIGALTLQRIAEDIGRPLANWRAYCFQVATAIIDAYELNDVQLWVLGSNNPTSEQSFHFMVQVPDGRVLDTLYCQVHDGFELSQCGEKHPFLGTKQNWGAANGFDAEEGYIHTPDYHPWIE